MKSLVVLFALTSVACGSLILAQPPHHPAVVLDPHGRPLDTAEVINARAIHLQAKILEGHHAPLVHAAVTPAVVAAPLVSAHAAPLVGAHASILGHSALGLAGHGHLLNKRSLSHITLTAPVIAHAPAALSQQSRVDVISSPAVVSHAIATPLGVHDSIVGHSALGLAGHGHLKKRSLGHIALSAPIIAHAPAAFSQQSRVDVISSPAVVSHAIATPLGVHDSIIGHSALGFAGHGHLKKRSLGHIALSAPIITHAPAAVSHQSRVDVISSPAVGSHVIATPLGTHDSIIGHSALGLAGHGHFLKKRSLGHIALNAPIVGYAPSAVSQQSRVDVKSTPAIAAPIVSHTIAAPVLAASIHGAHSIIGAHSVFGTHDSVGLPRGHLLKKRSLSHILAPATYDIPSVAASVISSVEHIAPVSYSAVWTMPASHLSHPGLLHGTHW